MEKCSDCQKDNGIFNLTLACCRERHYKMTLGVSRKNAEGELLHIRNKHGAEESDRLAEIEPPPKRFLKATPKADKPTAPPPRVSTAQNTMQAAADF